MKDLNDVGRFLDRAIHGLGVLGGMLLPLNGLICTYEIVMRYVFNSPTIWVMEVSTYVVIASTFLALAYVLIEKAHVKVDFITHYLSPRTSILLEIITSLLAILFCFIFDWESGKMALTSLRLREVSPTLLKIPMFIPRSFIPIGSFFLTVQFIRYLKTLFNEFTNLKPLGDEELATNLPIRRFTIPQVLVSGIFVALLAVSFVLLNVNLYLGLSILFFVLLFSGIPVSFALGLFGVFGFYFLFGGTPMLIQVPIMAYSTLDTPVVVALPLFVLTSNVLLPTP